MTYNHFVNYTDLYNSINYDFLSESIGINILFLFLLLTLTYVYIYIYICNRCKISNFYLIELLTAGYELSRFFYRNLLLTFKLSATLYPYLLTLLTDTYVSFRSVYPSFLIVLVSFYLDSLKCLVINQSLIEDIFFIIMYRKNHDEHRRH